MNHHIDAIDKAGSLGEVIAIIIAAKGGHDVCFDCDHDHSAEELAAYYAAAAIGEPFALMSAEVKQDAVKWHLDMLNNIYRDGQRGGTKSDLFDVAAALSIACES